MNLTSSKNPDSIVLGSAKIEVSRSPLNIDSVNKKWEIVDLEDLGLARGIKINFASSKIEIKADNGDVPIKGITDVKGSVEFALMERHIPTMCKVMGGLVGMSVEGSPPKKHTETKKANTLTAGSFIKFQRQNFDGSEPQNIVIKNGTKTLAKGTDYTVDQDDGKYGITIKTSSTLFDPAKISVFEYDVAGIKSYTMTRGSGGLATPLSMRLTTRRYAENGDIMERTYEFAYGFYEDADSITFKSKNDGDNALEVPMKFEFLPHPDLIDDTGFSKSNLYKETDERKVK